MMYKAYVADTGHLIIINHPYLFSQLPLPLSVTTVYFVTDGTDVNLDVSPNY